MARIKMHIPKAKLPFYPPCEVKCRLQNGVSTVRDCSSFTVFREDISRIALTFLGFASIPLWDTMNPRNFPKETPKAHMDGFNFMLYYLSVLKVSLRLSRWSSSSLLFTSISSTYTSTFLPICLLNIWFTNLWYVAPAFFRPKGITL